MSGHPTTSDGYLVASYRYLRLAIVIVVITLAASLVVERIQATCWLGSISAYYYTPVHAMFIGALVAAGVAMVSIKGRDTLEDLVLNLAGIMAPIVALVPTSRPGELCTGVDDEVFVGHQAVVANNFWALVIGTAAALALAYGVAAVQKKLRGITVTRSARTGILLSLVALAAGVAWYLIDTPTFEERAHGFAAVAMFVAIWVAVLVNAGRPAGALRLAYRFLGAPPRSGGDLGARATYRPWYLGVAVAMALCAVAVIISAVAGVTWDHRVLWLELGQMTAFGVFWVLQTLELWEQGQTSPSHPGAGTVGA